MEKIKTKWGFWTPEMRDQLREAYDQAVAEGHVIFVVENAEFSTVFAGYLLEFLDKEFQDQQKH